MIPTDFEVNMSTGQGQSDLQQCDTRDQSCLHFVQMRTRHRSDEGFSDFIIKCIHIDCFDHLVTVIFNHVAVGGWWHYSFTNRHLVYYYFFNSMLAFPQPSTRSLQHIYQVQLGRFFQDGNFSPEVSECLVPLVSVSISLYYCMCRNMLPTPTKSHYTFNVRDLSKVWYYILSLL